MTVISFFQFVIRILPTVLFIGGAVALVLFSYFMAETAFIRSCSRKLKSTELEDRHAALDALRAEVSAHLRVGKTRKARTRHVIKLLLIALRDSDAQIRQTAAGLLANQIDERLILASSGGEIDTFWLGNSVIRMMVIPFIRAAQDQHPGVRKEAIEALGGIYKRTHDTRVISHVLSALEDQEEIVRKKAAVVLRTINSLRVIPPLLKTLKDESTAVRHHALEALENACQSIRNILFDDQTCAFDRDTMLNFDVSRFTFPMKNLQQVVIDAVNCDISQVEAFAAYGSTYFDPEYLKKHVTISIYGDPFGFSGNVYTFCQMCKEIEIMIDTIVFGETPSTQYPARTTVFNPDLTTFVLSMPHLKQVVIATGTYDFHQVERFITYAVNYIGQEALQENVEVHLYGDSENLHPNLRNSLTNLCKSVREHR